MADSTFPKIRPRSAVVGWLPLLPRTALLAGLACSPLAHAGSTDDVAVHHQVGNASSPMDEESNRSLTIGEATNSADVAADIARSAARGALSFAVGPLPETFGTTRVQLNPDNRLEAGDN